MSSQSWAAIAFLSGSATCAGAPGSSAGSPTTSAVNMTGATLIIISSCFSTSQNNVITDSSSNTWTLLTDSGGTPNMQVTCQIAYKENPTTSASQTFTATTPTNGAASICVQGFTGTTGTGLFDVQSFNSSTNTVTVTLSTGSITPSANNELLVTVGASPNTTGSSISGGFTVPTGGELASIGGVYWGNIVSYLIQTTATAANPAITYGSSSYTGSAIVAAFKSSNGPIVASIRINKATINKAKIGF